VKLLQKIFSDRGSRERWDAGLTWFRLRYQEPAGPTRCISLLSQPEACGRIALYYRPGELVSQLFLGISTVHIRLLRRMATDFDFSLKPMLPEMTRPPVQPMVATGEFPWDRPFVAHIVDKVPFVSLPEKEGHRGAYLPGPSTTRHLQEWQLPAAPITGLTTRPSWNGHEPPDELVAAEADPRRWLLGRSRSGLPLHVGGRVNILGRSEAAADWLIHQVTQMLLFNPANLVVIDGVGDLVPRLKRKAAVTGLLGKQLIYVDIDDAFLIHGINPLAAVPGETEEALLRRWQRWFRGMNAHPQGLQLLTLAREDGVADIPSLLKWLKKAERQGQHAAVSSLTSVLNWLTADRALRERIGRPANGFQLLPDRAHFFVCKGRGWDRQQLQRALALAAMNAADIRLIIHGIPWKTQAGDGLNRQERIIISNGPLLPDSTVILVENDVREVAELTTRFLSGNPVLGENLQLLRRGEGIVITTGNDVCHASWQR
jgi:hypothetical protein